ncbi:MAG: A/G-specific adenine glycosylase [Eudoraea sp.]|nr:A/G-specific adenine glycosylase [Eudoraea sp.]
MSFSKTILRWYSENKRTLPWRKTKDPYRIWLSEVLLQQTRVAQGLPYYHKFLEHYPTVEDLAAAKEEEILKLWQGLGYYSRARNLHATARIVAKEYNGQFPKTYEGLLELKGVGDYTASAIASASYDLPEPVVDGNVYRVLSRYFGVSLPIDSAEGIKYFKKLAREVMEVDEIGNYNQAIMEFGAIQCTPKRPYCLHCPLNTSCTALKNNMVLELPRKQKKTKAKIRNFNYLILLDPQNNTLLQQRTAKGIWQKLYQFPLLETETQIGPGQLKIKIPKVLPYPVLPEISELNKKIIIHKLSHQHLYTKFWLIRTDKILKEGIPPSELENYAVPVLIADAIKTLKISYF